MRSAMWGLLVFAALGSGWLVGPASAAGFDPYDYPWCIQGRAEGYPGYCGFQTYAQCQAAASGRYAYCGYNPRFAFGEQRLSPRRVR
ncbi:DUF3551 domain-containing protein [Bradyrhizobium erythrophlei]|uniref:DUF3551 domain-containing protein n=1 Tax=Bradyrhizobium erythrophlei TaxID=1437360 RepID=UPI0035E516F4